VDSSLTLLYVEVSDPHLTRYFLDLYYSLSIKFYCLVIGLLKNLFSILHLFLMVIYCLHASLYDSFSCPLTFLFSCYFSFLHFISQVSVLFISLLLGVIRPQLIIVSILPYHLNSSDHTDFFLSRLLALSFLST
jgi:hypothetical protein